MQTDTFATIYHNCGGAVLGMLPSILRTECSAYHFGNAISIATVLERLPADTIVMGNVDPAAVMKNGTPETVRAAVEALLPLAEQYPNFVLSTGCDVPPDAPWENIDAFFAAQQER